MNTSRTSTFVERLRLQALMLDHKVDDQLKIDDGAMVDALRGIEPLSNEEWALVLDSPVTLRRMHLLAAALKVEPLPLLEPEQTATATRPELTLVARTGAANDDLWAPSYGRFAFAGETEAPPHFRLQTDNKRWTLTFIRTGDDWRAVLRVDPDADGAQTILEGQAQWRVVDGQGQTVFAGTLDEDGELVVPWTHGSDPARYLAERGQTWSVELV